MRATADPSLLVPAEEVWNGKKSQAALLRRGGFKPREYLLSALGQAAAISPNIEASLRTPTPAECGLNATGAYQFLQEQAWQLEQFGLGVLLPAWWTRKGARLRLSARANVRSPT